MQQKMPNKKGSSNQQKEPISPNKKLNILKKTYFKNKRVPLLRNHIKRDIFKKTKIHNTMKGKIV